MIKRGNAILISINKGREILEELSKGKENEIIVLFNKIKNQEIKRRKFFENK